MPADLLRPRTPPATEGQSDSLDARLLQDRLALLGRIAFLIAAAFYAVSLTLVWLGRERAPSPAGHAAILAMLVETGGTWLYCRRGSRSGGMLRALDAASMLVLGLLAVVGPVGAVPEPEVGGLVALLAVNLIVYSRSIFVPSSARRTLAVSAACALPLVAYSLAADDLRFAVWKLAWLAATVSVAAAGSAVIYGLRRQVRHARQLGQYTLEERLGEGGMGVVYRARHAMLHRPTAVKLLKPDCLGEASLARFEREVQLTAGLSHPNTVSVFDFGRTPEGVFYYAMEYLDGLTLDQLVAGDGPQPPGRVTHVLRQVLGALAEAHGVGLVHRDIKPGNIILCERGGVPDVAKVLDFGLVKDLERDGGLSHDGALIGTPHYLAPEAIRSPATDARADLYSLGAVAYFLLTGRHVFDGRTVIEICSHHLHTPPAPPSQALGRPLPAGLEAWVLGCLEKDPERRPRSAAEAAARLERLEDAGWTVDDARAWWTVTGRALAAWPRATADASAATLSRPILERAATATGQLSAGR